jgi:integrase
MKLTNASVATLTLPPDRSDVTFFDGTVPGLGLRLRAGGSRTFIFQYKLGRQSRRIILGSATALTAAAARESAIKLYARVKLGEDPARVKAELRARVAETLGAVVTLFLARQKERLRPRSFVEVERHLEVHAKRLHHLPLADVTRRDVAGVLTAVAAQLSGASANRVRTSLSGFFTWSIREGLREDNPAAWTERREEAKRKRLLSGGELREIWAALRNDAYGDILRLLVLCGGRREEIGALRWSEIDLEQGLITLPPERTKNKRPHEIVLSAPARAILKARPRLTWPDGKSCDLVFGRGPRGFADWVGSKADLDERIRAARKAANRPEMAPWVLHDFRRLLSTELHERLGVAPHIVESILGHVGHKAGTAGVYNLARYREEKRRALERWATHVEAIVTGKPAKAEVVSLRQRKGA